MPRLVAGYLLLAVLIMAIVGTIAWLRYNSRNRTYTRRVRQEAKADRELDASRRSD